MKPFFIKSIIISLFVSAILFSLDAHMSHILLWGLSTSIFIFYLEYVFSDVTLFVTNYRYNNVFDESKNFKLYLALYVFRGLLIAVSPFLVIYLYNQSIQSAHIIIEKSEEIQLYFKLIISLSIIGGFVMLSIKQKFKLVLELFWFLGGILIIVVSTLFYEVKLLVILISIIGGFSLMMSSLEQLDKKFRIYKNWRYLADALSLGLYSFLKNKNTKL